VGLDGDEIVAGHLPEHRKVRNVRNDSRVALSIETDKRNAMGLNEYLVIYGTARITEREVLPNFSSDSPASILVRMSAFRPWTAHRPGLSPTSGWIGSRVWVPGPRSADSSVYRGRGLAATLRAGSPGSVGDMGPRTVAGR